MRMNSAAPFVLLSLVFSLPARADMIEIRNRGVLNGKIVSQDDKEVRFEDVDRNLFVVPKSDVLFLEAQADAPKPVETARMPQKMDWQGTLSGWRRNVEDLYGKTKHYLADKTKGIREFINKPLDRSQADGKSKALADSMSDLSKSLTKMNKNERKRAVQLRGLNDDETQRIHGTSKASKLRKSPEGQRFASLD